MSTSNKSSQLVYSRGIYHSLPSIPDTITGLRAIVVGASGMSGQHMIDQLAASPRRWGKVYAMSRSSPVFDAGRNVEHLATDLSSEPQKIAQILKDHNVHADYIFFFAYLKLDPAYIKAEGNSKDDNAAKLSEVNGQLLETFLTALYLAAIKPKRFLLQTGLKWYGVHQGPINLPAKESDPRVELEPNFYYVQQDLLNDYCKQQPGVTWNNTFPSWILGSVKGSDMSIFYPLAVYASICRHLKKMLAFPGDIAAWDTSQPISSGVLDSVFHEWLVLDPNTANEPFNIVDGSEFTWSKCWPVLASWFGLEWQPPSMNGEYQEVSMPLRPRGYGPHGKVRSTFSMVDWAQQSEVQSSWKSLSESHQLEKNPFVDPGRTYSSLQFSLTLSWSWSASMDKARSFGWHGHVDSIESMRETFDRFVELKMIPPMHSWK